MAFHSVFADFSSWLLSQAFALAWWGTLVCIVFAARVAGAFLRAGLKKKLSDFSQL
jgi:hypothetical protein